MRFTSETHWGAAILVVLVLIAAVVAVQGCGGGSSSSAGCVDQSGLKHVDCESPQAAGELREVSDPSECPGKVTSELDVESKEVTHYCIEPLSKQGTLITPSPSAQR